MRRLRRVAAAATGLVLVTSMTACDSQTDRYCADLGDQKQKLAELARQSGDPGRDVLGQTLDVWRDLRDEAPGDIEDEWTTLVFALEGLVDAFHRAGTTPGAYDPGSPPPGVSEQEQQQIEDAAAELSAERVRKAGDAVEQHARDVCKVDLGLSS